MPNKRRFEMAKNKVVAVSELTENQKKAVSTIVADGGKAEVTKCQYCGKILIRDISIEQEAGDYCSHLREEGKDTAFLMAHRATMTATEAPEGFIKVAQLHKICERNNVPVARMVKAIGGDRKLVSPIDPRFTPIYVGNARWVDPFCSTKEGLAMIMGITSPKATKAPKKVVASLSADVAEALAK
jgi:hypothetical protein